MSEQLRNQHEELEKNSPETDHESAEQDKQRLERLEKQAEEAAEKGPEDVSELANKAEKETSNEAKERLAKIGEVEQPEKHTIAIDKTVKKAAYKKELQQIQNQLPAHQRAFSKIIHNNAVDKVSTIGGKTVARPSGLLGGSLVSLIGGVIIVWMSNHYGFRYNFFVFIALLALGFVLGVIIEAFVRSLSKVKHGENQTN